MLLQRNTKNFEIVIKMENLLRKLSFGEALMDRETKERALIMVSSTLFESDVDLFEHLPKIDEAIQLWKSLHPLLRCKVVDKPNENPELPADSYFAYASEEKINGLDNVSYLRLDTQTKDNDYWRLLHDRALNLEPVSSETGLMWRLVLAKLADKNYSLIITLNHAISDGLNSLPIVDQLLKLIDQIIDGSFDRSKLTPFELNPSMEEVVLKKAASIPFDPSKFGSFEPDSKIPTNLEPKSPRSAPTHLPADDKFIDVKTNECLYVKNLLVADNTEYFVKVRPLPIDEVIVGKLLAKCKSANAKLTGCLTIISALALRDMYKHASCGEHANDVYINMLTNFRPFENIGNLNMGSWPSFLKVIVRLADVKTDDEEFYKTKFWEMCKHETDSLHDRIKGNEMFFSVLGMSMMMNDPEIIKMFASMKLPRGGGVHFSLSNKGTFEQSKMNHIKISHCFSNTSCPEDRFAALLFYGMYTINKRLSWSIGFNPNLISDTNIEYFAGSIVRIIQSAINV